MCATLGRGQATFGSDSQEKWDEFLKLSMLKQQPRNTRYDHSQYEMHITSNHAMVVVIHFFPRKGNYY